VHNEMRMSDDWEALEVVVPGRWAPLHVKLPKSDDSS